ncbi:MAG: hypothetical protein EG823_02695 [Actinobacteria bacterium]|nr:hypothetical protein [Actinomycetota bacterium]
MTVQLSEEGAALLSRSLEWLLSELRMEICDTDRADFRSELKVEKGVLEDVIAQLNQGVSA